MNKVITKTFFVFGTVNSISVPAEAGYVLDKIKSKMISLHDTFNVFSQSSEVSLVNSNAGKKYIKVSADTYELINKSLMFAEETEGAFDISALPLTRMWKNFKDLPTTQEILKKLALVDYRNILLKDGYVKLLKTDMGIDFSGIAKGYAADSATMMLKQEGVADAIINFGGTVVVLGKERDVGITDPFDPKNKTIGSISVKDKAVVTSGSYERYSDFGGKRYHHIIDPHTGSPAETNLVSVSLIGESACELDALCTGIFVLGIEKGVKLISDKGIDAIFITAQGDVLLTNSIQNKFTLRRNDK